MLIRSCQIYDSHTVTDISCTVTEKSGTTYGFCDVCDMVSYSSFSLSFQTISYMAERIVGQGSFGIVFQVVFL